MTPAQLSIEAAGPERDTDLDQWFTEPKLARMAVEWPRRWLDDSTEVRSILEPSSGGGALLRPIQELFPWATVFHYEIDPRWAAETGAACEDYRSVEHHHYHLGVMNPPYSGGMDSLFLEKALVECDTVVAIIRTHALHGIDRYKRVWSRKRLRRIAFLIDRPSFGGGTARHEFCVVMFGGEEIPEGIEWWYA